MNIENVVVRHLGEKRQYEREYSDGPVEDEMLNLVKSTDFKQRRREMLANNPSWAMYYHFTPLRGNLVNWKTFRPGSRILEIGAGCGAITEALLETVDGSTTVDALELTEKRALINAYRNKKYSNLEVIVGNLEDFDKKNYDYVICVGVLEYSGRFISGDSPYEDFLKKLFGFLKPGGELLLAIENKLGIKYFNGSREDHIGKHYESLMDYPQYDGIRTFSRKELLGMFKNVGFRNTELYLPLPDYKIPKIVINEKLLDTTDNLSFVTRIAPAPAFDQPRIHSASEQLLTSSIIDAGLYIDMTNSFLVRGVK